MKLAVNPAPVNDLLGHPDRERLTDAELLERLELFEELKRVYEEAQKSESWKDKCPYHKGPCLYKVQKNSQKSFVAKVAKALRDVVIPEQAKRKEPFAKNKKRLEALARKATFLGNCGAFVKGVVCDQCQTPAPNTGEIIPGASPERERMGEHPRKCGSRACSHCGKQQAGQLKEALTRAILKVPYVKGFRWRTITATAGSYDPNNPDHLSPSGLEIRAKILMKTFNEVFRTLSGLGKSHRKAVVEGLAAFAALELAGHGHVHLHAIIYGPFINESWLEKEFGGYVRISDCGPGVQGSVKDAAKYAAKVCSALDEAWLGGKARYTLHPELAANWEAATWNLRLRRVYGKLLGRFKLGKDKLPDEKDDKNEDQTLREPKPPQEPCKGCGSSVHWVQIWAPTESWIAACHKLGIGALKGSRWKPPEAQRGRVPDTPDTPNWTPGQRKQAFLAVARQTKDPRHRDFLRRVANRSEIE